MRAIGYLVVIGAVVAVLFWSWNRWQDTRQRSIGARSQAPVALDDQVAERAAIAFGPDRGAGTLLLTSSQLVFTADSGRVLALDRWDIVGVSSTRELPDRTVAGAVLCVTTAHDTYFFAVGGVEDWVRKLTS